MPTDNGPSLTSQIAYDFSSVSHGNTVTFTATPYGVNADGDEVAGDSATIAVSVWKPIEATLDVPKKCVEDESIDIGLETTVPFDWVQYTIEGTNEVDPSNETSDTWSEIDHTFAIGGDRDGSPRTVTAVATYVTPSGTVVKSSPETATVKLYDNHGFQWRRMVSRVESFYNVLDDLYIFTSGHTIEYYYDGRPVDDRLRRKAGWYENGEAHGKLKWPPDAAFFATPAFWDSFTLPMDTPATLARGEEYHVFAYTNYGAGNAPAEVFSEKARYDPDAADPLPIPTGTEDESENPNLPDALKGESESPKLPDILR